jgi:hypothetical protein
MGGAMEAHDNEVCFQFGGCFKNALAGGAGGRVLHDECGFDVQVGIASQVVELLQAVPASIFPHLRDIAGGVEIETLRH